MPIAAFTVRHIRIDGGVIQVNDFTRITLIVFIDCIQQCQTDARTITLVI
jgi:hypothetical protein